jgi:hypothetical protein
MALTGHLEAQSPQPVQRPASCITDLFFQSFVSKAIRRRAHAEMQRPQPVQRAGSMRAISELIHVAINFVGPTICQTGALRRPTLATFSVCQTCANTGTRLRGL